MFSFCVLLGCEVDRGYSCFRSKNSFCVIEFLSGRGGLFLRSEKLSFSFRQMNFLHLQRSISTQLCGPSSSSSVVEQTIIFGTFFQGFKLGDEHERRGIVRMVW